MEVTEIQEQIVSIINKNQNIIKDEADQLASVHGIDTLERTKEAIDKIKNTDRALKIGIIGRVKAGKSSLLNALIFDGKSVLPKAATPMTAALTEISHGEELSAEVEYYSQKDIGNIEYEYKKYIDEQKKLIDKNFNELKIKNEKKKGKLSTLSKAEMNDKSERQAKREMKSKATLTASYDQFKRIKNSNIDYTKLPRSEIISANSLEQLSEKLLEYVGADGQYMPFTKSVHIKIPQDNLKHIEIVDTPGLNDPVQSREARTKERLKYCDVVFIVSPAGQFLSQEDVDLMDRITAKEGIRELYVIASQVDLQLYGSIKAESRGELNIAFDTITESLGEHLKSTMQALKENNPEVGNIYDQLINQSDSKIIHSSGISHAIRSSFEGKALWDNGTTKAWENLKTHYPDYFSESDVKLSCSSLDMLSNMGRLNDIIDEVKVKKEKILEARKKEFVKAKIESLKAYKASLVSYIMKQLDEIKNKSVEELKEERDSIQRIQAQTAPALNEKYYDLVDSLKYKMSSQLKSTIEIYFKKTTGKVEKAESTGTENYEISTSSWYNPFSWGGVETRTRSFITVRTGAIENGLVNLKVDIEENVSLELQRIVAEWRKSLYAHLLLVLREKIDDDKLDPITIKKVIRNVMNEVIEPEITYRDKLPDDLIAKGTLTKRDAERYIESSLRYIANLRSQVKDDISEYIRSLNTALKVVKLSNNLFSHYDKILHDLENKISNKELSLERFRSLSKQLEEVTIDG